MWDTVSGGAERAGQLLHILLAHELACQMLAALPKDMPASSLGVQFPGSVLLPHFLILFSHFPFPKKGMVGQGGGQKCATPLMLTNITSSVEGLKWIEL